MSQQSQRVKKAFNWVITLIVIAIVTLIYVVSIFLHTRVDMTEDSRYSLSPGTIEFLENKDRIKDRLLLKIYLAGKLPVELKRFQAAIEDKLKEFKEYAGKRIEYQFIDPLEGTEADQSYLFEELYAKGQGIIPLRIRYQKEGSRAEMEIWPGAEIEYGGVTRNSIQFLPGTSPGQFYTLNANFESQIQNSINNLEYMLISAIRRSTAESKPRIAFIHGHGELEPQATQRVRALISPYYSVEDITLNDSLDALKNVKGVVIARPMTAYSDKDQYIVDQFLLKGGRLMVFLDKLKFPQDSLIKRGYAHTERIETHLDKMLFDYGVKINDNYVIDAYCAPKAVPMAKMSVIPWFFDIMATPTKNPISRNIDPVMLRYASEIQFIEGENRIATPVLTSSTNSNVTGMAPLVSLGLPLNYDPNKPELNNNPGSESNKRCLAGLVEGKFESYFKNRIVDEFSKNRASGFTETSTTEGKLLVVSNGTFIQNMYDSIQKNGKWMYRPNGFNNLRYDLTLAQFEDAPPLVYGNQEFFQNMVDYMLDDNSVLDLRSRQIDQHPIDQEKVKTEGGFYRFVNLVIPSGAIMVLGILLFYLRRRRYTRI